MFPAIVLVQREVDLHEWPPLWSFRFANQVHPGFLWCPVRLVRVAADAGANDIFPRRRSTAISRSDVIQIQILPLKSLSAILADVFVALENVVPGELDLFLRKTVVKHEQNHTWHANSERYGVNAFRMRFLLGKVVPRTEIISLKGAVIPVENNLRVALEQKRQGTLCGADVDCLPQAIEHKHMLVQERSHILRFRAENNMDCCGMSTSAKRAKRK